MLGATGAGAVEEISSDVCVYGGTSGGVIAAVQAARMGKTVSLIVVNNHLGGMTSGGLGQTDIGKLGDGYIQGLAREFYTRVGAKYGTGIKFTFEPHVAEGVFNEMVRQTGLTVYTNQYLLSVVKNGQQLFAARMNNGNVFRARMFIDASYEGDLMAAAGVSYTIGRESTAQYGESLNGTRTPNTGSHQFGTLNVNPYLVTNNPASGLLPNIDSGAAGIAGSADQQVQAFNYRLCLTTVAANKVAITAPVGYSPAQYELLARYIQAMQAQGTSPSLGTFMNVSSMPNGKTDINNNGAVSTDFLSHSSAFPEADFATRAAIALEHKNYLQGFLYFLGTDSRVPAAVRTSMQAYGFCKDEFTDTGGWPHQLYVREARRMISDYVMTQSNCLGLVVAPDSIGLAAYAMDSHNCRRIVVGGYCQNEGDTYANGSISAVFPISYRSVIPKATECTNLLVPWCLSASHIGFASLRMEPVLMILGQSVGTAACLAINDGVAVQNLSLLKLQAQLLADQQLLQTGGTTLNSVIVDNADSTGVSLVGAWTSSTAVSGFYGTDYVSDGNTGKGTSSVTFTPTLPQAGPYQVYVRWTAHVNRDTAVPVDIIHPGGTNTVLVNQTLQGSQWVLLLTTNFNAGTLGKVRVRNTGTTGYVVADAVQFVATTNLTAVNIWATDALACRWGSNTGSVTVSRVGDTNIPLTVYLNIGGTATNGLDYVSITNSISLPTGILSTNITILPYAAASPVGDRTVILSIASNASYRIGSLASAWVSIQDAPIAHWQWQYFGADSANESLAGDGANPSGDSIPNLIKYALGLEPSARAATPLVIPTIGSNGCLRFSYTRPDPAPADLCYQVGVSDDLVTWCTNLCSGTSQILLNGNNTATVTCETSSPVSSAPKQFMRLQVARAGLSKTIQGATVVAFGDSITFGYGVPADQSWVTQLQKRFNLKMINAGISGNTSSQGLARIEKDVLSKAPDFVIINFGMNDHVLTGPGQPAVSLERFRSNLVAMVDRVRAVNAIPVLITVNYIIEGDSTQYYYSRHPAGYYTNVGGAQAWLDSFVQVVRDVAAQKEVALVDVRNACNSYDRYDFLRSLVNAAAEADGVHPYLTGSTVYARQIGDFLEQKF